ncbi:MAG TPA: NADP-dependent oxidoreductase [Solirubrobacteraceae bacterium]|nr:NADP-dependent oxidoreductase [Solirubrobacteraceae bacterium]
MPQRSREIRLAGRPEGEPELRHFELAETEVSDPGPGEVLVRNLWMSVDPYMRGRMSDRPSYVPPFELGAPLQGGAIGEVIKAGDSKGPEPGTLVTHQLGWREYATLPANQAMAIDPDVAPPQAYLGVLGMPGLTAYVGLLDIGELREGDVVFVSAAAGAVGSLAGQIAKARGHRVIGSAGPPEKVAWVRDELGFDAVFSYRDGPVAARLSEAAPEGIDLYFDNVGGEHLEAAIGALRVHGRIAMCGAISSYNDPHPTGPRNLTLAIGKRLTMRGFIILDHFNRLPEFVREVAPLVRDGKVRYRETVVEGIERAPEAFIGLLRGDNVGKMLVKLA